MLTAKINNHNRNRIKSYWVREQNRVRNKLQIISNQSDLNVMEKIHLLQEWKRFNFFQYNLENKDSIYWRIWTLEIIRVVLGPKHFNISLLLTIKSLGEHYPLFRYKPTFPAFPSILALLPNSTCPVITHLLTFAVLSYIH